MSAVCKPREERLMVEFDRAWAWCDAFAPGPALSVDDEEDDPIEAREYLEEELYD